MSEIKRAVHLLDTTGATRCGLGGIRFSTEDPAQATCKSCLRSVALAAIRPPSVAASWTALRKTVAAERERRGKAADEAPSYELQNRYWGWTDALDWVLTLIDPEADRMARTERADYTEG